MNTNATPIITATSSSSIEPQIQEIKGHNVFKVTLVICLTVVVSILAIGCVIAIAKDGSNNANYVSLLLPLISGAISGLLGFFAGWKSGHNKS